MPPPVDEVERRRLRWRARRGLLENDVILGRFLDRHEAELDEAQVAALRELLELPDGELLDLLLGRAELSPRPGDAPVRDMLRRLRAV